MAGEKASFYSRDPGSVSRDTAVPTAKMYMGEERRRSDRRSNTDRRGEVRFDLNGDRRQNAGRRAQDSNPQFW